MNTRLLPGSHPETAAAAAEIIKNGGLVAVPTETVYGLGANGLDENAVKKIFEAKGRPQDNPLILHLSSAKQMDEYCHNIPKVAYTLAEKFWPGPLTMVLPAKKIVPKRTTGGLDTVAVRCPDCDVTRKIIALAGVPLAAPSANLSGKPSTTTAQHVLHDHDGKIEMIVDGGACRVGVESTIIDLTGESPRLLRPGGITLEQLHPILGDIIIDKAVVGAVDRDAVVKAPGMKYRHYAPDCRVLIIDGSTEAAKNYITEHFQPGNRVLCFEEELESFSGFAPLSYGKRSDPDTLLAGLFSALRELDDPSIGTVFARQPMGSGKALAVQNRLLKAAGFCCIDAEPKGLVLGITGPSGSGKTTLLEVFEQMGGWTLDCDRIYHELLKQNGEMLRAVRERFPETFTNGFLDRKKLGRIVFADPAALKELNAITHIAVYEEVLRRLQYIPGGYPVAIDAIGLFEGGLAEHCDTTVAVTAPEETRVQRLMHRDGITEDYARSRIAAQHSSEWFSEKCDHTLVNDGTDSDFRAKCVAFLQSLGIMKEKS